ncbi:Phosphotransferase enzyme family protein [Poriferisphaera corsica]|uniref:Phosphotransferase enzyme family protein n=1 Tax=Poriferisphaera corsica TaxID=2528020 RepID=A0A517YTK7_9BACT|nr:phosphotransferase [Poriferisphaera corsica]QDU33573.1 Phosphotransferase enzyme family protein [Poriferisphaera corsica]
MPTLTNIPPAKTIQSWMNSSQINLRKNAHHWLSHSLKQHNHTIKSITYLTHHDAQESIVAHITSTHHHTFIAKIAPHPNVIPSEAAFLTAWQNQNIQTPIVFDVLPANHITPLPILLLEYLPYPLLDAIDQPERIARNVPHKLGQTLARMHQATASNFGRPLPQNPHIGQHPTFTDEINDALLTHHLPNLINQNIIPSISTKLAQQAIRTLENDLKDRPPSNCHCDIKPSNIFITPNDQLIIFDPNSRITHPAMCLALAIIRIHIDSISHPPHSHAETKQLLAGYHAHAKQSDTKPISNHILQAAFYLRSLMLLRTFLQKNNTTKITQTLKFLHELI